MILIMACVFKAIHCKVATLIVPSIEVVTSAIGILASLRSRDVASSRRRLVQKKVVHKKYVVPTKKIKNFELNP